MFIAYLMPNRVLQIMKFPGLSYCEFKTNKTSKMKAQNCIPDKKREL